MANNTYDPKEVTLAVTYQGATSIIEGYAQDSSISIAQNTDTWTHKYGMDRKDTTRSRSGDESATITVTLELHSQSNKLLTAIHRQDKLDNTGTFDVSVTYKNTGYQGSGEDAYLTRNADLPIEAESANREWNIMIPVYDTDERDA